MKIIKSFLLLGICLHTATLLHAQDLKAAKAEVLKPTEVKAPPVSTVTNKPSPAPELEPMNGVADEKQKQPKDLKPQVLTKDANAATKNLTPEQLKTLNGVSEKPKKIEPLAAVNAQTAPIQVILVPAPVMIKEQ